MSSTAIIWIAKSKMTLIVTKNVMLPHLRHSQASNSHHADMPMIILHNTLTTKLILHSKTHYTQSKRMHHYLPVILPSLVNITLLNLFRIPTTFQKVHQNLKTTKFVSSMQ